MRPAFRAVFSSGSFLSFLIWYSYVRHCVVMR